MVTTKGKISNNPNSPYFEGYSSTPMKRKYVAPKGGASKKQRRSYKSQGNAVARKSTFTRPMRVGEVKGVDTDLTIAGPVLATTGTNGDCFVLNLVPPGTGSWNRVGRKIYMRSLRLKGSLVFQYAAAVTTANLASNYCRMVVVWDKQPSGGAIPSFDTVFGVTNQAGTESCTILSPPRYDNMDRFKVLKDCVVQFDVEATPPTTGSTNIISQRKTFDEYFKVKGESVYSGQTATQTIADISTGALYVFFRASLAVASVSQVAVESQSWARLRYTD